MCTNKIKIFNQGRELYVNCGHCPACLQQKANYRAQRIRNNTFSGERAFFVTLTYSNDYVPYFKYNELRFGSSFKYEKSREDEDKKNKTFPSALHRVPIYRDTDIYGNKKTHVISYFDVPVANVADEFDFGFNEYNILGEDGNFHLEKTINPLIFYQQNFKNIVGRKDDAISVIVYDDIKRYFKRLRKRLKKYGNIPFRYFSCAEYGPTTCRAHFHLLIWSDALSDESWKTILSEAWPFGDYNRTRENIQVAKRAAQYVSSYVNCVASIPDLFKSVRSLRPSHSYSHNFGMAAAPFTFHSVQESIYRGSLRYLCQIPRNGVLVNELMLLPKYVINRYFAKFKGHNRLTSDEVESVVRRPETIGRFKRLLEYDEVDLHREITMLYGRLALALKNGISPSEYAFLYSRVWPLYYSEILRDSYDAVNDVKGYFERYDNISEYFDGRISNAFLDSLYSDLKDECLEYDPNRFVSTLTNDAKLINTFNKLDKSRKIRNYIYNDLHKDC